MQSTTSDKPDIGAVSSDASSDRKYIVKWLVLLFGLGSWFGMTTIFSQMPIIASTREDTWLPLDLSMVALVGNSVSLLYVHAHRSIARPLNDAHAICMLMAVGCVAAICLPFTYHVTIGSVHIALHIFIFIFAMIGGFSSMLFMPYMKRYRGKYLYIFFLGQALNDLLSNALAAFQGTWSSTECVYEGSEIVEFARRTVSPSFSPTVAFLFVFPVLALSTTAFILLNKMKVCRDEQVTDTVPNDVDTERGCDPMDQTDVSIKMPDVTQLRFIQLLFANVVILFAAIAIFPLIHSFTCQQYARRPHTYIVTIALIVIYKPLIWYVVTLKPQQCMSLVRRCSARVIILVPYLFFYIYDFLCVWPLHSLLALILLVSFLAIRD